MKYQIKNYVEALVEALEGVGDSKKEAVLKNFVSLLARNGDISKKDKITQAVHRKMINMNGGKWVVVELAREIPEARKNKIKKSFTAKDYLEFKINPSLVAGLRITIDGEREFDNSLNNKLNKLFA